MNNKFTKYCLIALITMISFTSYAQDPGGDGGDQELPEAAPINDYLPLALMAGIGLGYVVLRKKMAKN